MEASLLLGSHSTVLDQNLHDAGFGVVRDVVRPEQRAALLDAFSQMLAHGAGNRDGLCHPAVRALAAAEAVHRIVEPVLGRDCFAYRATLFDKTSTANWLVAWHQDLVVPVRERRETTGFGPWSQKGLVWFVQPPEPVLRTLLAVRIDLDGSDVRNGALRVLPGTHRLGVLGPSRISELAASITPVTCAVPAGSALVMRPLLLHASSRADAPTHRRIVHLEFAAGQPASGLTLVDAVTATCAIGPELTG